MHTISPAVRRLDAACVVALAALAVAFWADCVFGDRVPVAGVYQQQFAPYNTGNAPPPTRQWDSLLWDGVAQFYPWRELAHRSFSRNGEFPLWNPHQFCGTPFVGNGQSGLFYPPHWLLAVCPTSRAMGLLNAMHYFLAGLFVYLLLRVLGAGAAGSLLGGLVYSFGGFIVTWTELPSLIETAVWLPAGLLGVELIFRRSRLWGAMVLALALGMSLLAGHLQIAAYVWLVAGGAALAHVLHSLILRRKTARAALSLLAGFALGAGLGAVQALPALELGARSPRGGGDLSAAGYQFHLERAMVPAELTTVIDPDFPGSPVTMDYPRERISYSEHCAFIGAAGFVGVLLALLVGRRRKAVWLYAIIGGLALWVSLGGPPAYVYYYLIPKIGLAGGFSRLLSVFTFCAAVLCGLGVTALSDAARARVDVLGPIWRAAGWALVLLFLLQALPWAYRFNPRTPAEQVYPRTEIVDALLRVAGNDRVLAISPPQRWTLYDMPEAFLPPNSATVYGYYSLNGYDSLSTETYRRWAATVEGGVASPAANGNMLLLSRPYNYRAAGCRYYLTNEPLPVTSISPKPVYNGPEGVLVEDTSSPGYAYGPALKERPGPDDVIRDGPNRISMRLSGIDDFGATIAEGYYPGWVAIVNGVRRQIGIGETTFMQIAAPAGAADVELYYVPSSVGVGGFMTLLTLAVAVALVTGRLARRRSGMEVGAS